MNRAPGRKIHSDTSPKPVWPLNPVPVALPGNRALLRFLLLNENLDSRLGLSLVKGIDRAIFCNCDPLDMAVRS